MYAYAIRILPKPANAKSRFLPGVILWAGNSLPLQANENFALSQ
jgi:hypothetical protein